MKEIFAAGLVAAAFICGFWLGVGMGEKTGGVRCERTAVDSILTGKPFAFVNGQPVVLIQTMRGDGSIVYNARAKEAVYGE